jgi:uncharacterized DUF497 family protein
VGFQWDAGKAAANIAKHGVSFADAVDVFFDQRAVIREDPHPVEERQVALGMDTLGRILVVAYCWRGDDVRIISARKANRAERSDYEQEKW